MKKTINGIRYDTTTAIRIGFYWNGLGDEDQRDWSAYLYKTPRSGRFFLSGMGGPMTRFARSAGDMSSVGEAIFPMSEKEAIAWSEQFIDSDEPEWTRITKTP